MKIYTKTGDQGQTSLLGGARVAKSCRRLELLGTIDELNSNLGVTMSLLQGEPAFDLLERTQRQLFAIGAELARPDLSESSVGDWIADWTSQLESEIDRHDRKLKPLTNFILPGGGYVAASLHLARAVCRRAERVFFAEPMAGGAPVGVYLNRLGDWLFVLARLVNQAEGRSESIWSSETEK